MPEEIFVLRLCSWETIVCLQFGSPCINFSFVPFDQTASHYSNSHLLQTEKNQFVQIDPARHLIQIRRARTPDATYDDVTTSIAITTFGVFGTKAATRSPALSPLAFKALANFALPSCLAVGRLKSFVY